MSTQDTPPNDRARRLGIISLALTFPTLQGAPGVMPWNPDKLAAWAKGPASSGGRHAAAFVLGVYSRTLPATLGLPFEMHAAMETWDVQSTWPRSRPGSPTRGGHGEAAVRVPRRRGTNDRRRALRRRRGGHLAYARAGVDLLPSLADARRRGLDVTREGLERTHVHLGTIAAKDPDEAFALMKDAERWAPREVANDWLASLGAGPRASMFVGDVIEFEGKLLFVEVFGFTEIKVMDTAHQYAARMTSLAESFHSLRGRPGVSPWDPDALDKWATEGGATGAERAAARFVLSVWDPWHAWRCGAFDMHESLRSWDDDNRAAFARWTAAPWWA